VSSTESGERYEVVVKHYLKGVLRMRSFNMQSQAYNYLIDCWTKLPAESGRLQIDFGGAIYDKHESRKRVLVMGADYLTNEDGSEGCQ